MTKINYIQGGESFVEKSGYFDVRFREISASEYKRLTGLDQKEVNEAVANSLPQSVMFGYGYYGFRYMERNGRFFIGIKMGKSSN